jgi:hypothetical protein
MSEFKERMMILAIAVIYFLSLICAVKAAYIIATYPLEAVICTTF